MLIDLSVPSDGSNLGSNNGLDTVGGNPGDQSVGVTGMLAVKSGVVASGAAWLAAGAKLAIVRAASTNAADRRGRAGVRTRAAAVIGWVPVRRRRGTSPRPVPPGPTSGRPDGGLLRRF